MHFSDAANTLMSVPESDNNVLTVCPGSNLSFTCSHENVGSQLTRWETPLITINCVAFHDGVSPDPDCSPFTITMTSDNSGSALTSTLEITVTEDLDGGTWFACRAGGFVRNDLVGNITIRLIGKRR